MPDERVDPPIAGGWRLDKHVPIALIVAIGLQTGGIIWWASSINARVATLETERTELATDRAIDRANGNRRDNNIIRLETQFIGLEDSLRSIDAKLDKLVDRQLGRPTER